MKCNVKKLLVALCLVLSCFAFATVSFASGQIAVKAAAGGVGGGWYTTLAGLAEITAGQFKEINMQVVPGAGLANPPRVGEKGVELALSFPPFTKLASEGKEPFPKKYNNLRCIANGFGKSCVQFVVDESLGIKTFEQFIKQKKPLRIAVERVGTTDEWEFRQILAYYKLDYKTIESWGGKITHAGYGDQTVLIKDRQVDAIFGNVSIPWTAVMEASIGRKLVICPLSKELQQYLYKNLALIPDTIPAGAYKFVNKPVQTVACLTQLICHKDVPDDVVYKITKAICDNYEKVRKINDSVKQFDPNSAWKNGGAPLHPGAAKYYKEKGWMK